MSGVASSFARELFAIVILSAILVPPIWRIYSRAGLDPKRALFVFVPGGWMASVIDLAMTDWPAVERARRRATEKSRNREFPPTGIGEEQPR